MVLPDALTGGWRRRTLQLGDAEPGEGSTVIWLQAGEHFADLRVPHATPPADGHVVMSFAGTTSWCPGEAGDSARLRWSHILDFEAWPAEDGGAVWFEGGELIEQGVFDVDGESVPYTEVWTRLPSSTGNWLVMAALDRGGLLVRVGDHCLTVVDGGPNGGGFDADYRVLRGDSWNSQLSYGATADRLPAPPDSATFGEAIVIDGVEWRVVEARPSS